MKTKITASFIRSAATEVACGVICAGTHLLWGAYPLGTAFIMSFAAPSPFALAGALIGCCIGNRIIPLSMLCCVAAYLAQYFYIKKIGIPSVPTKLLISAAIGVLGSFEASMLGMPPKAILLYGICNTAAPVIFCLVFIKLRNIRKQPRAVRDLLPAVAVFVISRFSAAISVFGVPLSLPFGCFAALLFAHRKGGLYGVAYGFACGIAAGAPSVGALGIVGLTYGMFDEDSPFLAATLSFMLALPAYAYLSDYRDLTAAAVMLLLPAVSFLAVRKHIGKARHTSDSKGASNGLSLGRFAAAFSALSGVFYTSGDPALGNIAAEYDGIAGMLSSAAVSTDLANIRLGDLETLASSALDEMRIVHGAVRINGRRDMNVEVEGVAPATVPDSAENISSTLGKLLGARLSMPEFVMDGRYAVMRMHSIPLLRVETAKYQSSRSGETVCGDTLSCFETPDRRFCCVIADGMGSGDSAAASSRIASSMAEKLLCAGSDTHSVLAAVNRTLCGRSDEVFSTLDILVFDRMTSETFVTKSGAAPCYLLRGGECRVISAQTPPLGILQRAESVTASFTLCKNDILVMVSDGVYPVSDDDPFPDVLSAAGVLTAGKMLDTVVSLADSLDRCGDDMTVCVMRFY